VFGSRQDDRKLIPAIKRALEGGKPLVLHNRGEGYRQYVHVSEIPPVVAMLLEFGNRTYNVTTSEGMTVSELVHTAGVIVGKKVPIMPGNRNGMDIKYQMDGSRLFEEFGWQPSKKFEDHLKEYLLS